MNITELDFTDGKEYIDNYNNKWTVCFGELYRCIVTNEIIEFNKITKIYTMKEIFKLDFTEYVDWNKVKVDTKVTYIDNYGKKCKGHFAEIINDTIYVWRNGCTSFTTKGKESVRSARLYIGDNKYGER